MSSKQNAKWRAKRREVMDMAPGCHYCGDESRPIHVHHRYYEAGKKPWDYPLSTLSALCPRCHGHADELRRRIVRATGELHEGTAMRAIGYMQAMTAAESPDEQSFIRVLSYEHAMGIADAFVLTAETVLSLKTGGDVVWVSSLELAGGHAWRRQR